MITYQINVHLQIGGTVNLNLNRPLFSTADPTQRVVARAPFDNSGPSGGIVPEVSHAVSLGEWVYMEVVTIDPLYLYYT